ncbi:MAG: hypothetical protein O7H41_16145 [Planctomycetota bacterium]|nr:hypothetical protein [Planctomycetota bacterium]
MTPITPKTRRFLWVCVMLAVAGSGLVAARATLGGDDDTGKGGKKPKRPPLTRVKVDISEKVDGNVYTLHKVHYRTLRMLWFAGLDFQSERKTKWDKDLKAYKPRKKEGVDFMVKGEARARLAARATLYDKAVAYVYTAEAEIEIEDGDEKPVARFLFTIKRGGRNRDQAIEKILNSLGNYVSMTIVECEAIRSRIPEHRKEALKKTLDKIRKEVEEFGGSVEELDLEDEDGGGKERGKKPGRTK